jgi:hypothetical protein
MNRANTTYIKTGTTTTINYGKPPLAVQTNVYHNDEYAKNVLNVSKESSLGSINRGDIEVSRRASIVQSNGSLAKSPSDTSGEKTN